MHKDAQKAIQALNTARKLGLSRRKYGVQGIILHIKDVDGDWLESWVEDTLRK